MKNKLIIGVSAILITLIAGFFYNKYRIAPEVEFGSLSLTDVEGNTVNPDSFRGKKLFINFFATWCGPCMQEMPSLAQVQAALEDENFQFVFISDEPLLRLQNFRSQIGNQLMILHSEKKLSEHKIVTLPTSYVLNSERKIVFKKVGVADWASETIIEKIKEATK